MKLSELNHSVSTLPGTGAVTGRLFARLHIFTVADLLQFYPKDYDDRTERRSLAAYATGKVHTAVRVTAHEWFGYGKMRTLKICISDDTAQAALIAFNRAFLEKTFSVGSILSVTGVFTVRRGELQSTRFDAVKLADEGTLDAFSGTLPDAAVLPLYPLTEGLRQKNVRKTIAYALQQYGKFIDNELPPDIIANRGLLDKQTAVAWIHTPRTMADVSAARRTLIYEELFQFQAALAARAWNHSGTIPEISLDKALLARVSDGITDALTDDLFVSSLSPLQRDALGRLPFALTGDQKRAIVCINNDLDRGYRERNALYTTDSPATTSEAMPPPARRPVFTMARLLEGDVGSGKTVVALFACLRVVSWGGQCAFMAPTEILARQHAESAAQLLEPLGVRVAFLTGNVTARGQSLVLDAVKNGTVDIVIGMHALFSARVCYNDLQLAVIDEQHRFGVLQRQAIIEKGRRSAGGSSYTVHLLMMSATPIPQTLALTVFGDLDVSVLAAKPAGRQKIKTYLVREGNERNAYEAVRKELSAGHQAYFVYPAIGDRASDGEVFAPPYDGTPPFSERHDSRGAFKSAEQMFLRLSQEIYPEYTCALVHSRVDEAEQRALFEAFRAGTIQVLAATTVIEVGVDVPNATCIVVEQADRFGLAQLHQLRGRVGRSSAQSYCFLIYSKSLTETGIERMKIIRESTDGFYIAEQDLKLRGPGEVLGLTQAGALTLGIADVVRDHDMLLIARADAFNYLHRTLRTDTH
ncbi:MAG: ATP-dependent DNA helicase RecG [Treponema sp.]|nr:ATP-dependent DNA helicase RecG [Treponema sp.]